MRDVLLPLKSIEGLCTFSSNTRLHSMQSNSSYKVDSPLKSFSGHESLRA